MNNHNDKKIEEIVEQALRYIDAGKTPAEILALFPDYQKELKEIFFAVDFIKNESGKIYPDKEIFKQVMAKIPLSVTNEQNPRYSFMKEVQGRPSWSLINNITKILNPMTMNWKIIAPVGVVAVIALVIVGVSQFGTKSPQTPIADSGQVQEAPIAVSQDLPVASSQPATGDIDETVNAILAAANAEETYFADAIKDNELIAADSQSINNFGQSYYENEF
jgi:negative regulator of sigma E activity